ncbi:lipase member M-like isoform X2 [Rhineura floridana]|uniref:lipase member M-like isoform X2 n=1 Tax=Rhineura floridana TaxID=261503 RepID=UPI002AC892A2|nr:lipase member M-like isoform X2 [Rhineura floridana]
MWMFLAVACLIPQATDSEVTWNRHLNPQEFMTINEIIQYWGYPYEEHDVLTEDGYYLKANRIPFGIHGKTGPKPVVLLVHGVTVEGRCWIANLPNNSLGFVLADAGYDVWILNNRGTTWSRRHKNLSVDQEEFWNFSFHEMGIYDIPATINFILQKTQQDGLYYIGHSQGGAIGLVAFSSMPQLAEKVKLFMGLAPAYTIVDTKGPLKVILSLPEETIRHIWGKKEFCVLNNSMKKISANLCSFPVQDKICLQIVSLIAGCNEKNLNVSRVDVYARIYPDYTSVKDIVHWSQDKPPFYKIEAMVVRTAIWNGGNDIIVGPKNIEQLLSQVPNLVFYKYLSDWNHADFMWGLDAPKRMYLDMLHLMQKYK